MPAKTEENAVIGENENQCAHHWIIDPPNGSVSKGVCIKCGAKKEFPNHFPRSYWDAAKAAKGKR